MLGIGRRNGSVEVQPSVKSVLGPPPVRPGGVPTNSQPGASVRPSSPPAPQTRETPAAPPASARERSLVTATPADLASGATGVAETPGSKLFVGVNIKLKGVEISDCDVLVVEGHIEATVFSKGMQIAEPGTLNGTATIDVAEIFGQFSGELTARERLVVHGTGRVSGTIRYGKLIVAEGGELTGDVKKLDGTVEASHRPRESASRVEPGLPVRSALDFGGRGQTTQLGTPPRIE